MPAIEPIGPMVRLRDLRQARGLRLADLTERIAEHGIEVTVAGLSNIETGRKRASDRLLHAWARALGVDPLDVWQAPVSSGAGGQG
ncbi:helix-turn-helix transcriptional regulator [Nocardia cyriacigeorgica]|uniref:helix-turn-helix domain-containing protein n=1 Tax=Nocardia cyriacigeorgica TaxID=135487 RepID=UPI001895D18E|nr:helix-turn-helix transcriptional regulator [Nocardia cyriacigeorgica]MBF6515305.1 helix-turn-helix transcriptional regulator [Nocardia cyriacigeorgica]